MTRIKNATFTGVRVVDSMRDAPTFGLALRNAAGDTALVYDLVTGENGETPIDHTGSGLGCPLRLPICNQSLTADLIKVGSGSDNFIIIAVPVFVAVGCGGKYLISLEIPGSGGQPALPLRATIRRPSGVILMSALFTQTNATAVAPITLEEGMSTVFVDLVIDSDGNVTTITNLSITPEYGSASTPLPLPNGAVIGNTYAASAATFSTTTEPVIHDTQIEDNGPLDAWVTSRLARTQNTLWEQVTGGIIPGNEDYRTSTELTHSRSIFASEGLLSLPVVTLALGSIKGDPSDLGSLQEPTNATTFSTGLVNWSRIPTTRTGTLDVANFAFTAPVFAGANNLKARVLFSGVAKGTPTNWRARLSVGGVTTSWVTLTSLTGDLYVTDFSAISHTTSTTNDVILQMSNTAGGAHGDDIYVLGITLYYEP